MADSSSASGISVAARSAAIACTPCTGSSQSSIPTGSKAARLATAWAWSHAPLASMRIAICGPANARTAARRPASSPIPTFTLTVP